MTGITYWGIIAHTASPARLTVKAEGVSSSPEMRCLVQKETGPIGRIGLKLGVLWVPVPSDVGPWDASESFLETLGS